MTGSKTYSMCMSIDGFRRNNRYPRDYKVFEHDDGRPTRGPGRMFIQAVTAVQAADSTDQVICTVQERYDV